MLYLKKIDSTNTEAKRQAEQGAPDRLWVVADEQTDGRGRRGRSWESPAGNNIFATLLLYPSFSSEAASMITLVMALSVTEAIREETELPAYIKWPNDVVVHGKKVVGILTELAMERTEIRYLICGVGVNVNQEDFSEEIRKTATSLYLESGRKVDREMLLQKIAEKFDENYAMFCQKESMQELQERYNELLVNKEVVVRVLDPKGEYEGVAHGINEKGELLVERNDGILEAIYAGEVSVRGIYGYV